MGGKSSGWKGNESGEAESPIRIQTDRQTDRHSLMGGLPLRSCEDRRAELGKACTGWDGMDMVGDSAIPLERTAGGVVGGLGLEIDGPGGVGQAAFLQGALLMALCEAPPLVALRRRGSRWGRPAKLRRSFLETSRSGTATEALLVAPDAAKSLEGSAA